MQTSTIIIIVFSVLFAWIVLANLFKGLRQGLPKTAIRFGFLMLSTVITIFLTRLCISLAEPTVQKAVSDGFANPEIKDLLEVSPSFQAYIYQFATAIVAPLVFLILFVIVNLIMKIPQYFVNSAFGLTKKKQKSIAKKKSGLSRLLGAVSGLVCAVLISTCLFMPFIGYAKLSCDIYDELKKSDIVKNEAVDDVFSEIKTAREFLLIDLQSKTSIPLFNMLAVLVLKDGEKSLLYDEAMLLTSFITESSNIIGMQYEDINQIDVSIIESYLDKMDESPFIKQILAEIISGASKKWLNNELFMNISIKESLPQDLHSACDVLLTDFSFVTRDTVIPELKSVSQTFAAITDIANYFVNIDPTSVISDDRETLDKVIQTIDESGKLKKIMAALLSDACTKWANDDAFLGVEIMSQMPADFHGAIKVLLNNFANTDQSTICNDLDKFSKSLSVFSQLYTVISDMKFDNHNAFNIEEFDNVISLIEGDELITAAISALLNDGGEAWGASQSFLSIDVKEALPTNYKTIFDRNIEDFKTTTPGNAITNLKKFSASLKACRYAINLAEYNASLEELGANIKEFANVLNEDNVDILKDVITKDMLIDAGVKEEDSLTYKSILSQTIEEMSKLESDKKEEEAEALNTVLAYSRNLTEDNGGQITPAITEDEFVDAIMNSSSISKSIQNEADDQNSTISASQEQRDAISSALAGHEVGADAEQQKTIDAIKKLFGITQ